LLIRIRQEDIVELVLEKTPCLVIDCSTFMDPHKFFGKADIKDLKKIFIVEVEMLYKYRDTINNLEDLIKEVKPRRIIITRIHHLFNYQDEFENKIILKNCNLT